MGLNRYCVQVLFYSPEFELNTRFVTSISLAILNSSLNKGLFFRKNTQQLEKKEANFNWQNQYCQDIRFVETHIDRKSVV